MFYFHSIQVDPGEYKKEYRPNWGFMSFLSDFLRPYPYEGAWYKLLKKGGGGCNDLLYSGHMLVAVLTAMAWTVCTSEVKSSCMTKFQLKNLKVLYKTARYGLLNMFIKTTY